MLLALFLFAPLGKAQKVPAAPDKFVLPGLEDLGLDTPVPPLSDDLRPPKAEPILEQQIGSLNVKVNAFEFKRKKGAGFSTSEHEALERVAWNAIEAKPGGMLTAEDLEAARVAVTIHYVQNGHVNSGAVLPDQGINDRTVTFLIIEGTLTDVHVVHQHKHRKLRDGYLKSRIELGVGVPLDMGLLQDPLLFLHRNPNIRRLNAELKPGLKPGEGHLQIEIEQNSPHQFGVEFANNRPPSVGEFQATTWYRDTNFLGFSDSLELRYGWLDRGIDEFEHEGFRNFSASYSLPVNRHDTTLSASYQRNSYAVIEEPFDDLDIDGQSTLLRFGVRHPWRWFSEWDANNHRRDYEFALGLQFDRLHSETTLFGSPFSVNKGAVNGEIEMSVLRLSQEFTRRSPRDVLALRAVESFGIDAFGVTDDGSGRNGTFFSFLAQGQYVRKLGETDAQIIARGNLQLSNDPLLSAEQFSIGGTNSVRGYRENQLVRDMGYFGSLELQVPVLRKRNDEKLVTLATFVDVGGGWNHEVAGTLNATAKDHQTIASAGLGILVDPFDWLHAQLYWGYGFTDFDSSSEKLQDSGFHLLISAKRF